MKPKPVKSGEYGDNFSAILSPDGEFYLARIWEHHKVAYAVTGEDWDDLVQQGWCRLAHGSVHFAYSHRDEMTQAQLDALFDYAQFLGCRIEDLFSYPDSQDIRRQLGI